MRNYSATTHSVRRDWKGCVRAGALFVLGLLAASPAMAVNLVTNPSFNGNLNGWLPDPSTTYDPTTDATGIPGSGSAKGTYPFAIGGRFTLAQCIPAGPGNYTYGGKVLIPNGQTVGDSGKVFVNSYSAIDCSAAPLNGAILSTSAIGSFQTLSGALTAPAGTAAIQIAGFQASGGAGTHIVYFDDFVLDDGRVPVSAPALSRLGLLMLGGVLAAAGFVGRRSLRFTSNRRFLISRPSGDL